MAGFRGHRDHAAQRPVNTRVGAALPMVLLAIALMSALAVGSLSVSRAVAGSARLPSRGATLHGLAEGALTALVASWDTTARAAEPVGVVRPLPARSEHGATVTAWTTRIGDRTWWLVAEATMASPPLRRRLGLVIHMKQGVAVPVPARAWATLP